MPDTTTKAKLYRAEFKADVLRLLQIANPSWLYPVRWVLVIALIHAWRKADDKGEKQIDQSIQQEFDDLSKQLRQAGIDQMAEAARDTKKAVAIFSRQP